MIRLKIFVKKRNMIANFYKKDSAMQLQQKLIKNLTNFTNKNLYINTKGKNNYELITGTYNTVTLLKNNYIALKKYGFEELDIINE